MADEASIWASSSESQPNPGSGFDDAGAELQRAQSQGGKSTFDGPARAARCAAAIAGAMSPLGIAVRSGLHTGEIEIMREDVGGIAVHIAARVADLVGPGEVLVSSTVRDLVAGSGLRFRDLGSHTVKGLEKSLHLYAVAGDS